MKIISIIKSILTIIISLLFIVSCKERSTEDSHRPNFVLLMSDNQSWNHLGCYGDPVLQTPTIDQLAEDGLRFTNAYCSSPSCSPARAAMLTGQDIWRLEEAANLWGIFPSKFEVFTELLEESGYLVGYEGKGWGPGNWEDGDRTKDPSGEKFYSFEEFYNERESDQPFFYWFSSRDPHRPFKRDGWKKGDIDIDGIEVPPYLPDVEDVRKDIGDYYAEIESFDRDVASYLQLLREMGHLGNTIIIVCSDNGWQMPRGLANLYDFGTRLPFIISMPETYTGGRVIEDFVNLNDLAPTILELANVSIPEEMNAKSFVNLLDSDKEGQIDPSRDFIVTGRERHAWARMNGVGYGSRAYRTKDYLYIRNYNPEYWPAGDPPLYGDVDAHMLQYPSFTKMYMLKNKDKDGVHELFELAFDQRPAEELYDLNKDPYQMVNVASLEEYKEIKNEKSAQLTQHLLEQEDPRATGKEMKWKNAQYFAEKDKYPKPSEEAIQQLGLKEEYSLVEK